MAFRTNSVGRTYNSVLEQAAQMKAFASSQSASLAAGNRPSSQIIDIFVRMRQYRNAFTAAASVPGMAQYARDQADDQAYDVVAEFNAMNSAIDTVTTWITTNFPSAGGFLQAEQWGTNSPVDRTFTPAQTGGLRNALDAVAASVV